MSLEELVLEHERTVMVEVTHCAGPGCEVVARTQAPYLNPRRRGDYQSFTPDSMAGWYALAARNDQGQLDTLGWEFCSFACVRQFMLGKDAP